MTRRCSIFALLLLSLMTSLLLVSCGGSSNVSNSQPPQTQTPIFVSTAPLDAHEGEEYTYSVSATDPAGGSITLALTKAPGGARLSGNTLSWTPQWEQSRKSNAFEITATNAEGISARQNWSVAPAGTVYVQLIDTYIHADGTQEKLPRDLSGGPYLFFPSEDLGGSPGIPPVSFEAGVAVYRNVPAGHFYISLSGFAPNALWTDKSNLDLGTLLYGRPVGPDPPMATLTEVNGIRSLGGNNWLEFHAPNVRISKVTAGWTKDNPIHEWVGSVPIPFDPAQGDSIYILEYANEWLLGSQSRVVASAELSSMQEGANNELKATLIPLTEDLSFRLNVDGGAWTTVLNQVHSVRSSFRDFEGGVYADPLPLKNREAWNGDSLFSFDQVGVEFGGTLPKTNVDFGWAHFGSPFPDSRQPELSLRAQTVGYYGHRNYGEEITLWGQIGFTTATLPGEPDILAPLVRPVTNIMVEGKNAIAAEFTITTNFPTISWTPPAGAPRIAGYAVSICPLEQEGQYWYCVGSDTRIYTTETSVKLTSPIAWAGDLNAVWVQVITDPEADFATKPFFQRPTAWADSITKLFRVIH